MLELILSTTWVVTSALAIKTGPEAGSLVPSFEAPDQNGQLRNLKSILGPKGAMLVFFRSADWWPFCKTQLVELEQHVENIREQGLGLAAISYDSVAVLKNFTDRKHITYPLLSDPDSKIIRAFGILNETVAPNNMAYGIPYPGTYVVDPTGKVVAKFFVDDYHERIPTLEMLEQSSGALRVAQAAVEAKHLKFSASASTNVVHPNQRVALFLDLDLPPKMHVYAPGVEGYIAIDWKMAGTAARFYPVRYPASEKLRLEVIKETVPVYRGHFRLIEDVVIGAEPQVKPLLNERGELSLEGSLRYQACDDHECYIPETVPLKWTFRFEALDRERVPSELQHKDRP